MMKKRITMYRLVIVFLLVIVTVSGCSESQKSEPLPQLPSQETAEVAAENAVSTPVEQKTVETPIEQPKERQTPAVPELSEKEVKAQKQLEFAQSYMDMANKKKFPYDQSIAICRDVIKNNPGTEYETLAREILRQVPEDKRDRYNITNEELGL